MRQSILRQHWFYLPYIAMVMVCVYLVIRFSKADLHIFLNQCNAPWTDVLFKYLTILGDGNMLPVYVLIMLMITFRDTFLLIASFLLSGLFVQLLKRFVFDDIARPLKYFEGSYQLHFVEGIQQHCCHSFPSGHSATAFGVFFCFALVAPKHWQKLVFFILAGIVAYSRVYLSQHFLIDIMAGSFLGILAAIVCYLPIYAIKKPWLDKNLTHLIRKKINE